MRVLVVGCGYVGLPLGTALVQQGHSVWGLRRSWTHAPEVRGTGIQPVTADLTDPGSLRAIAPAFDWIVNCAASGGGTAEDYRRIYLEGTRNLLDWLGTAPLRRYVYTSSTGVYGQTDGSEVSETAPAEPSAPTAQVLVQTEQLLLEAARRQAFPAIILRLAGIYGPGRGYWLRQVLAGAARIEGDGRRVLNMVHRDDVVGAVLAALERGQPGAIYNVSDDAPVAQGELLAWLAAESGCALAPAGPPEPGAARQRTLTSKRVSNRRLRTELGYTLAFPTFRQGLAAELAALRSR